MANTITVAPNPIREQIENGARHEIPAIARLLAAALAYDPLQRWLFPDDRYRLTASEKLFRRLVTPRVTQGLVSVSRTSSDKIASVAVWTPPTPPAPSRWEQWAASLAMRMAHGKRIHEVRQGFTDLAARHPQQPYWYLLALATAESQRGQGHASHLLETKIDQCHVAGQMIVLETSLPENVSYYERFGFRTENEVNLQNGPAVWLMCRQP